VYENVVVAPITQLSTWMGPKLEKYKVRVVSTISQVMRYIRKHVQNVVVSSLVEEDLIALEADTRSCLSLVQQERRRRTVAEFSASRDNLAFKGSNNSNVNLNTIVDDNYLAVSNDGAEVYRRKSNSLKEGEVDNSGSDSFSEDEVSDSDEDSGLDNKKHMSKSASKIQT
jgi:hypothetical protein